MLNFDTPSGLPLAEINIKRKKTNSYQYKFFNVLFQTINQFNLFRWTADTATAEVGTVQLEMRDLSRAAGDKKYEV